MVQPSPTDRVPLATFLQGLTLSAFINLFLHIRFRGKVEKWTLYPLQRQLCDALDAAAAVRETLFWLLKARQVGGTEIIAAWCVLKCLANPGYSILVLSKNGGAARKFVSKKLLPMLDRLYKYAPNLPWPTYHITLNTVTFSNGSVIEAINSANHAGRGDVADAVVMDEAGHGEFEHHAEDIVQSVQGTTEHGSSAFMVVMGTSAPGTWFNARSEDYYQATAKGQATPGIYFFFLSMAVFPWRVKGTPEGDAFWARRVVRLGEVGARQEYPENPADAFMSKSGYVFPQFERPKGRHVRRIPIDWSWSFMLTYDHGRTHDHPAYLGFFLYQAYRDFLFQFDELFWEDGQGIEEICKDINEKLAALKQVYPKMPRPRRLVADTAITNDIDGRQTIRDLIYARTKLMFQGAHKHDEKVSLDWTIARVNENRLVIDPDCTYAIDKISHLLWDKKKSRYGKPVDLGVDPIDVLRYTDAEIITKKLSKIPEAKPIPAYSRAGAEYRAKTSGVRPVGPVPNKGDWRNW
jgi:Phage terminase large subunit (GpA)